MSEAVITIEDEGEPRHVSREELVEAGRSLSINRLNDSEINLLSSVIAKLLYDADNRPAADPSVPQPRIQPGSVVQLKSGGPAMTVERICPVSGKADCFYFSISEECRYLSFSVTSLELVTKPEPTLSDVR